ncbi:MAG: hypothetical protein LWX56_00730 [Ignavibacteria bacterium]|nr:hypothetical protein [Ignavibacteria bacterium]
MKNVAQGNSVATNVITVSYDKAKKIHELHVNGMIFLSPIKNQFHVPATLLRGINTNELPKLVGITPYVYVLGHKTMFPFLPMEFMNIGKGKTLIKVESCSAASQFTDKIGVEAFQALKKEMLLTQKAYLPKIDMFHFDGDTVHLHYNIVISSGFIEDMINEVAEFDFLMTKKIIAEVPDIYTQLCTKFNLPNRKSK